MSLAALAPVWQADLMKHPILLLLATLIAAPVAAQSPMTAAEFDAYSRGKTFYYGSMGEAYGVEQYFDNRRVKWSFLDGQCSDGVWYERDGLICFEYEEVVDPNPQCWTFFKGPSGLIAQFEGDPEQTTLYEVQNADEPMTCLGPEVGV
ncbi:hypothetical protein [Pseudooceanicola sp.]|uniref:hypothetical protein n=2 Tax=Pseudooceanicola sp. TaxID=1914328 RepID=UPI0035C780FD